MFKIIQPAVHCRRTKVTEKEVQTCLLSNGGLNQRSQWWLSWREADGIERVLGAPGED